MSKQSGFVLPFAAPGWAIYAMAAAAALGALWYAYTTIEGRGHARGQAEVRAEYALRDNKALSAALARVAALQAEKQAREQAHETRTAAIAADHKKEIENASAQRKRDIAAVDAGYRLRDPGRAGSSAECDRGAGATAQAATGQRDASAGAELSATASGFLFELVAIADDITRQLGAAQQVIREQIRACNGP